MNNRGNEAAQKENEKSTENKLKDMKIHDLNNRKFKIAVLGGKGFRTLKIILVIKHSIKR